MKITSNKNDQPSDLFQVFISSQKPIHERMTMCNIYYVDFKWLKNTTFLLMLHADAAHQSLP
jgi:hypothetical protein